MILLLDNHDSFVHNLARYVRLAGEPTRVIRSDQIDVANCRALAPLAIILSPGPKRPEEAGCCVEVVRQLSPSIPILGVCLGHQAIGLALGGKIVRVPPMHGRGSDIRHDGSAWFADCPSPMPVGRYHSLAIRRSSLPPDLLVAATTVRTADESPVVMAIRHCSRPLLGVQFHPESVLTPHGFTLINNFVRQARLWADSRPQPTVRPQQQVQPVS
ncbi:MAG: aminodeoxychorismate/anthranilate synthase component II [Planctomycetaceae bacterium]|nr:MAG: aminodeoxychorismate/anthranilate synthase component II [Planctomycetaceae bacterium]